MAGSIAQMAASATSISYSTVSALVPIAPIATPFRRIGMPTPLNMTILPSLLPAFFLQVGRFIQLRFQLDVQWMLMVVENGLVTPCQEGIGRRDFIYPQVPGSLVHRLVCIWHMAAGQLAVFQGASEAPISES
jgi:hypothetical protein